MPPPRRRRRSSRLLFPQHRRSALLVKPSPKSAGLVWHRSAGNSKPRKKGVGGGYLGRGGEGASDLRGMNSNGEAGRVVVLGAHTHTHTQKEEGRRRSQQGRNEARRGFQAPEQGRTAASRALREGLAQPGLSGFARGIRGEVAAASAAAPASASAPAAAAAPRRAPPSRAAGGPNLARSLARPPASPPRSLTAPAGAGAARAVAQPIKVPARADLQPLVASMQTLCPAQSGATGGGGANFKRASAPPGGQAALQRGGGGARMGARPEGRWLPC